MSSAIAPVGITSIGARTSSPSRMTEPLPNWRSIWARAVSRALSLSPPLPPGLSMPAMDTPAGIRGFLSALTLLAATDKTPHAGEHHRDRAAAAVAGHHARHNSRRTTVRSGAGHAQFQKKPPARRRPPQPSPHGGCSRPRGPRTPEQDKTHDPRPGMASARFLGYLEGLAHRAPDRFRLDSLGQGLVHRPAAQAGQHKVLGHAGRVRV